MEDDPGIRDGASLIPGVCDKARRYVLRRTRVGSSTRVPRSSEMVW